MGVDHGVPVVVRHLVDEVVPQDPGARDEDVQPTAGLGGGRDGSLDVLPRRDIAANGATADRRRRILGRCEIEVRDDDVRTFGGEAGRRGGADPARPARHERGLTGEPAGACHRILRTTISATHTGLSPPSRSTVVTRTACSPSGTSSTDATVTRARMRDPAGTGAGNLTLLVP